MKLFKLLGLTLICVGLAVSAWTATETQSFNTAPGDWTSRAVSSDYSDIVGWSNTNHAGTATGEAHAKFHRLSTSTDGLNENIAWYADTNLGGTLDYASMRILEASGSFYINDFSSYPDLGAGIWLGWFHPGWGTRMGIMLNDDGGAGLGCYAGIYNNFGNLIKQQYIGSVNKGVKYRFMMEFDNLGGVNGVGRFMVRITPAGQSDKTAILHLSSALINCDFNTFGLTRPNPSANSPWNYKNIDIYIDDLSYSSNTATLSISDSKRTLDGSSVTVGGMVTYVSNHGFFYIESSNRSGGIRVDSGDAPDIGSYVTVTGSMGTLDSGERYVIAAQVIDVPGTALAPIGMTNKALGGGKYGDPDSGRGQAGVENGNGLNNIGLLVRTTGVVGARDDSTYSINDGSGVGVTLTCPWGSVPNEGSYIAATGISSCYKDSSGNIQRRILDINTAGSARYETESTYTTVVDASGSSIGTADYSLDNGTHVSFPDVGDSIRVNFTITKSSWYRISIRNRAGYNGDSDYYWETQAYDYDLDGGELHTEGIAGTLSGVDSGDGSTIWGTTRSGYILLLAGNHDLTITARSTGQKLDYVDIDESVFQVESNYTELYDAGADNIKVNNFNYDDSSHVLLMDIGDKIRVGFTVPADGMYQLSLRNRSGDETNSLNYWNGNCYSYALDGSAITLTGDPATISALDTHGVIWGWTTTSFFYLNSGYHTLDITANGGGCRVDVLQVADIYRIVDSTAGRMINTGVRGHNPSRGNADRENILELCYDTSIRSNPPGGLAADAYDWRDINFGISEGDPNPTTLECLRDLRDHNSWGIFTANMWGSLKFADGKYYCRMPGWSDTPLFMGYINETAKIAGNWIYYTNHLVQTYRSNLSDPYHPYYWNGSAWAPMSYGLPTNDGNAYHNSSATVANSIVWGKTNGFTDYTKILLDVNESPVPRATVWEIGNEPEVDAFGMNIWGHPVTAADYSNRYHLIRNALKNVDSDIMVGPCLTAPWSHDGYTLYLARLKSDNRPMDFIASHPYSHLVVDHLPPDSPVANINGAESGLRNLKFWIRDVKEYADKYAPYHIADEYNASWRGEMTDVLTGAEYVMSFAYYGYLAANYWSHPNYWPVQQKFWPKVQDYLHNKMLDAYFDGDLFRMYTTKNTSDGAICIWGLNFSDTANKHIGFSLRNLEAQNYTMTKLVLRVTGADTSLISSGTSIDWDVSSTITVSDSWLYNFVDTFEDATITLIVLEPI